LKTHLSVIDFIPPARSLRGARLQAGEGGNKVLEGAYPRLDDCPNSWRWQTDAVYGVPTKAGLDAPQRVQTVTGEIPAIALTPPTSGVI